jgi:hypothetical protein
MNQKAIHFFLLFIALTLGGYLACGGGEQFFSEGGDGDFGYFCNAEEAAEEETGSISGTVTDSNGTALSGCTVELWSCCACVYRATTDSSGNYSISNVAADSYNTKVFCPPSNFADSSIDITAGENLDKDFMGQ